MNDDGKCTLGHVNACKKPHSKIQETITADAITKIEKASKQRGDGLKDYLSSYKNELVLHRACRATYISTDHIERYKNKRKRESLQAERSSKSLRSDDLVDDVGSKFDPKIHCLYGKDVHVCKLPSEYDKKTLSEHYTITYE